MFYHMSVWHFFQIFELNLCAFPPRTYGVELSQCQSVCWAPLITQFTTDLSVILPLVKQPVIKRQNVLLHIVSTWPSSSPPPGYPKLVHCD